jgi:hypothetical protein
MPRPLRPPVGSRRQAKVPIYVMNARGLWLVDGERLKIEFLGKK